MRIRFGLTVLTLLWAIADLPAQVTLEYVAHACFVVESPSGRRIVIDPYNSGRWLGYQFPEGIEADAVLITHPHYDHDASYQLGANLPVFRLPGVYRVGDVEIRGVRGKHADPYGKDFEQVNTIWVVESGGVRVAHLGDNGPLGPDVARTLQGVDVLMMPIDGQDHILKRAEIDAILESVKPAIVVPMHYQIPSLSDLPRSLGSIDPWLENREYVERLTDHRKSVGRVESPANSPRILVFPPSPAVRPWEASFKKAMQFASQAQATFESDPARALALLQESVELAPDSIVLRWGLARALMGAGQTEDAVSTLQTGLSFAPGDDWEYSIRARLLLARLYEQGERKVLARAQYRLVLATSLRPEVRRQAAAGLGRLR